VDRYIVSFGLSSNLLQSPESRFSLIVALHRRAASRAEYVIARLDFAALRAGDEGVSHRARS
jgi:hypothetical protein